MMKSGTARIDMSPVKGEELAGYPHFTRENTGVHDPLFASCLYLNNGRTEIAMITLDILFFSKRHAAAVRERTNELCGIKPENIMISCSHTHSGPWASGRLDIESLEAGKQQPKEYIDGLIKKIVSIIVKAKTESFEAAIACGTAYCGAEQGVGGNRTTKGGPHDPLVSVISVKDMTDKVRCVFVNYSLHPTFIHEESTVVTADYPCYLRRELEEHTENAVVGFAQGASGNQSSRYYRHGQSFDEAERVGRELGKAAYHVVETAEYKRDIDMAVETVTMPLELCELEPSEIIAKRVAEDEAYYKKMIKEDRGYLAIQNANLKLLGSEDQLGYAKMKEAGEKIELLADEQPVEIQIIRLGDACIIGVQGEVFVEYALYIKAMAGFPVVIFNELANGCMPGYLYTPESRILGGYEVDTSMLGAGFGRHMVDTILDTIGKVK